MIFTPSTIATTGTLQIQHQPRRVFQALLDADQERHRFLAVDHAVIVGQRQIHHRADLDPAADRHRAFLDLVHAENGGLRRVQDRRRHQRTVDAAIGDGEGAALHLVDLELAVAKKPIKPSLEPCFFSNTSLYCARIAMMWLMSTSLKVVSIAAVFCTSLSRRAMVWRSG